MLPALLSIDSAREARSEWGHHMVPLNCLNMLLRHFDGIDASVASRMMRKRPWLEPALTQLLCDLMDGEGQSDHVLEYPLEALNRDMAQSGGMVLAAYRIETHEYPGQLEGLVTQSDIGLVLNYRDFYNPDDSWSRAWLLQAKRIQPDSRVPLEYSEQSRVASLTKAQVGRLESLVSLFGDLDFVRFLFYCPRASSLEPDVRGRLTSYRSGALQDDIFDYAFGLLLRDELLAEKSTLEAGVFLSQLDDCPTTLGAIHKGILRTTWPLSWFLVWQLNAQGDGLDASPGKGAAIDLDPAGQPPNPGSSHDSPQHWAHGLVRGNPAAVDKVVSALGVDAPSPGQLLPAHTLTIDIAPGHPPIEDGRRNARRD